jgi:hypothetical protein
MGKTAGGGRENYHVAGEHVYIAALFLNNFLKVVKFLEIFWGWFRSLYA